MGFKLVKNSRYRLKTPRKTRTLTEYKRLKNSIADINVNDSDYQDRVGEDIQSSKLSKNQLRKLSRDYDRTRNIRGKLPSARFGRL